jgi:hypothetical protein
MRSPAAEIHRVPQFRHHLNDCKHLPKNILFATEDWRGDRSAEQLYHSSTLRLDGTKTLTRCVDELLVFIYTLYLEVFLAGIIMCAIFWVIDPSSRPTLRNWTLIPEEHENENEAVILKAKVQDVEVTEETSDDGAIWALVRRSAVRDAWRMAVQVEELTDLELRSLERKVMNERRSRSEKARAEVVVCD